MECRAEESRRIGEVSDNYDIKEHLLLDLKIFLIPCRNVDSLSSPVQIL
jgi:hypothetical protein